MVVSAGSRGRHTTNDDGTYNGKGHAGLVDLKAAIRYLRYNSENLYGDMEKIIATGHSAGGALVTLLGTTGNSSDYDEDEGATKAAYFRISVGSVDACHLACMTMNIAAALNTYTDSEVIYNLMWDQGHISDAGSTEFFEWTESICK